MNLFEKFSSKENLKQAFLYLRNETDESSLPLDPIWRPSISSIVHLGDDFFETLQDYLKKEKYKPAKADYIYASKDNLGVRPICIFSVIDRIIYQAIFNPKIFGNIIDKKLFNLCYGNRILGKKKFLKPYKNQWAFFCDKQKEAFNKKLVWRVEFDIQTYYEIIHIDTLLEVLSEQFQIKDKRILDILSKQLKGWSENATKCGIPQGANASHILANAYLYPLDIFIDDLRNSGEFEYFKYADDIVIMAKNPDTLNHIVDKLVLFLRRYNLKLNEKTKLEKLKNTDSIEELKFYNPYGQLNETSQQKIEKISKKIPCILRKIKNGNDTKKSEISALKYYLKAGANLGNPVMIDDLIILIQRRPSLTYLACRYLGFYLSDVNENTDDETKRIVQSKYEKIWKTYRNNSLTEWTRFWLLKVLSAPSFAQSHIGFQAELKRILADPNSKFFRPLAFFYKAYIKEQIDTDAELDFGLDDIKKHIRNSEMDWEKAIYYYFSIYLVGLEEDERIKELLYEALQSDSPEVQMMGIFLVNKLYELFEPVVADVAKNGVVNKWDIKLEREITGELSRIYFKIPQVDSDESSKEKTPDYFNDDGKIAQDKLAPIFGLETPIPVKLVGEIKVKGLQEGLSQIAGNKNTAKNTFPYSMTGIDWKNVMFKFEDDENVYIKVKQHSHNTNFKEMGFIGRGRDPKPSEAWTMLEVLGKQNGEIAITDSEAKQKYKKQKEILSKVLKAYFKMESDPFYPYSESNSYRIRMTLIPPPTNSLIVSSKKRTGKKNDDFGLDEYYDEQAKLVA